MKKEINNISKYGEKEKKTGKLCKKRVNDFLFDDF